MKLTSGEVLLALLFASLCNGQVVNPANGHTYMLTSAPMDVWAARAEASAMGGYLVAVNDAAENAFIATNFSPGLEQPWIGLSDEITEGVFLWDSGEPLVYSNLQADDFGGQDHVQWVHTIHQWADIQGTQLLHGVIEIPATVLPVPSPNYPTIQSAINAAVPGATVLVAPGTYFENIDFLGKDIVVESTLGAALTVIDGSGSSTVVTFANGESSAAALRGFTLQNGLGNAHGGGVACSQNSSPTIERCVISGNCAPHTGGGIYVKNSAPVVRHCIVANNDAGFGGGGIGADTSPVEIVGCVLYGNTASGSVGNGGFGGAIWVDQMSASISSCTITQNSASQSGGALTTVGAAVTVTNSILWGDVPNEVGGFGSSPTLNACVVDGGWGGPGAAILNTDPLFVNPASSDFHLNPGSLCANMGDNSDPLLPVEDIDGDSRVLFGVVDIGADELTVSAQPALALCGAGNVGLGQVGGPFDLIFINGGAGLPARRVDVGIGVPIQLSVNQPPTNILPAPFAVFGFIGYPSVGDTFVLPFGVGEMCFTPFPLAASTPGLFTLANSYDPVQPAGLVGATTAPWITVHPGLPSPFTVTLQGVISQDPATVRVTNGVILRVQ